jgi:aspartyl protease family protein
MEQIWSPEFAYGIGALVLVLSALSIRNMGIGRIIKALLAWVMIFALIFVAFSFRYELEPYWLRVKGELTGDATPISRGGEVRIRLRDDNHFHASALVNGKPIDMLIDTGATFTAMGTSRARELGIKVEKDGLDHEIRTANGNITAYPAKIDRLQVGDIEMRNVTIFVADEFEDVAVLGMNFLRPLKSWRVEGAEMILVP